MMSLKRFFLLTLVAGYRPFRGKADKIPRKITRVVVIQMAKLGDMVCTTPVFHAIKHTYPEAHLTVIGSAIHGEVLAENTDVDEFHIFESLRAVRRIVQDGAFDVAIIAVPEGVSSAICYLANVPCIIVPRVVGGFSPFESTWYRLLRRIGGFIVIDHRMGQYTPREYLRLLEPIGIRTRDTTKHLAFSSVALQKVRALLKERGQGGGKILVGIAPSAGNKIKNWGSGKFAALANQLARDFPITVVIFGGERDREEVEQMRGALDSGTPYRDLSGVLSIDELKAAISLLGLFIATDTGPIYIAEAFNVATVDIVGPVDEREQPPRGENHFVVVPPGIRVPQLHLMNVQVYDAAELKRQIESTSVEAVYAACAQLLGKMMKHKSI